MPKMEGFKEVRTKLAALRVQAEKEKDVSVFVGYTQDYAFWVHENLEATHARGKQAKYLEEPARKYAQDIARVAASIYKKTKSVVKALLAGGLRLQRESQKVVPVDTGALKASAYVEVENGAK